MKKIRTVVLLVLLCLTTFPATALSAEPLPFSAEVKSAANGFGIMLYGTLETLPEERCYAWVYLSLNGTDFTRSENSDWDYVGKKLSRVCAFSDTSPLKEYLSGEISAFFVKMLVIGEGKRPEDGRWTQTAEISRKNDTPELNTLPAGCRADAGYPAGVYLRVNTRPYIRGQIYVTAAAGSEQTGDDGLLPGVAPVKITVSKGGQTLTETIVDYTVGSWQYLKAEDGDRRYVANGLIPPESFTCSFDGQVYRLKAPAIYYPLFASVVCAAGNEPEILLSQNAGTGNLLATFALKPSGAQTIETAYSTDGGDTWEIVSTGNSDKYPVNAIMNTRDYSLEALSKDSIPMKRLQNGEINGFLLRIAVLGGVYDGRSSVLVWPAGYEYTAPPLTVGNGGTGNRGDAGAADTDNGGIRPGTENSGKNPDDGQDAAPPVAGNTSGAENSAGEQAGGIAETVVPEDAEQTAAQNEAPDEQENFLSGKWPAADFTDIMPETAPYEKKAGGFNVAGLILLAAGLLLLIIGFAAIKFRWPQRLKNCFRR